MTPSPWWDKARHADRKPFLDARAAILRAVRDWFTREGFTEVEPNVLVPSPGAETHVDAFEVGDGYLHTSPEFAMKRLLAAGERRLSSRRSNGIARTSRTRRSWTIAWRSRALRRGR
jgi:lysyl-tRNA synthetase class 2